MSAPATGLPRMASRALPRMHLPPASRLAVPLAALGLGAAVASGRPALVAVALVPLLLATVAQPDLAAPLFVLAFYLNLPVVLTAAAGLPTAVGSAFALVLLVPIVVAVGPRREGIVVTPVVALLLGYLAALVLSATIAGGPGSTSAGAVASFLSEGLLLFVLVLNAVRSVPVLRTVVWALLAAGAVMGTVSIWQTVTGTYTEALGGFAQVAGDLLVGFGPLGKELRPRIAGPIGETNRYAQVMLVLVPLGIAYVRGANTRPRRLAAAGATGLILAGVLLTYSRGAAVALGVLAIVMAATGFIKLRHVVVLGVALVAIVIALAPQFLTRLETLAVADQAASRNGQTQADGALRGRATENLAALNTFRDHPLIGVGPGQFFERYSRTYANELDLRYLEGARRAHSLYLELAADGGALGLIAFLAVVGATLLALRQAVSATARSRPELSLLAHAFALSLVAYLTTGFFLQLAYQRYFWVLLALADATALIALRAARDADAAALPR